MALEEVAVTASFRIFLNSSQSSVEFFCQTPTRYALVWRAKAKTRSRKHKQESALFMYVKIIGIILRQLVIIWFSRWGPYSRWRLLKMSRKIKFESSKNIIFLKIEILTIISNLCMIIKVDTYSYLLWKGIKYLDKWAWN